MGWVLCAQDTSSTRFFPLSHRGVGGRLGAFSFLRVHLHSEGPGPVLSPGLWQGHSPLWASCWEMS